MPIRRPLAAALVTAAAALIPLAAPTTPALAASPVTLGRIYYDSPGTDTGSSTSLNAEWFTVRNTGTRTVNLAGWTVRDASGHVFRFGTFYLRAGYRVRVHTGEGTGTSANRYWNRAWYVWNNTGDKATMRNAGGTYVDSCAWSSKGAGYIDC
ncbi:MAG: lamin tail domain-containing protein [Frankiaceae bacterium]